MTARITHASRVVLLGLRQAGFGALFGLLVLLSAPPAQAQRAEPTPAVHATTPSLDDIEHRTFRFFWQTANPDNGLVPDHWPREAGKPYFSSIAAVGFALTAYPIGVERGWITRAQARQRVLATLRFFANAPQGDSEDGDSGYHGFFYHFLDMQTGLRHGPSTPRC